MTIDERIEKLEFLLTGHIEQAHKDYAENRRLWRDQQTDIAAIWKAIERRDEELHQQWRETDQRFRATDDRWREMRIASDEREQRLDERVDKLVTAIGELCRRLDGGGAK